MGRKPNTVLHQLKNVEDLTAYEKRMWEAYIQHDRSLKRTAEYLNVRMGGLHTVINRVKEKIELQEALRNAN